MLKEAIILAGGFGTRLQTTVSHVPKPMAPINGKPFLEYLLNYAVQQNIEKVILSTGYKHEIIYAHFGHRYKSIVIEYAQEIQPLGTGGGIQNALKKCTEKNVLVLNGDSFFAIPLNEFEKRHLDANSEFSIAVKKMYYFNRYGSIKTQNTRIISFEEKKALNEGIINAGVYLIEREKFLALNLPKKFSMEKEYMEKYFANRSFYAFEFNQYFIDIGIPEDFEKAHFDFKNNVSFP